MKVFFFVNYQSKNTSQFCFTFSVHCEDTTLPQNVQLLIKVHNTSLQTTVQVGKLIVENFVKMAELLQNTLETIMEYDKTFGQNLT